MEKEFCIYTQALALKELGFDEPCLKMAMSEIDIINAERTDEGDYPKNSDLYSHWVAIPTYSAAFRWFREKHNLVVNFISYRIVKPGEYNWSITWNDEAKASGIVKTYEAAEQACLDKLIEIYKNK